MRLIIKKIIGFILFFGLYYNICFLLFLPEIYWNPIYLTYLILYYIVTTIDTFIRPISEKREIDKYTIILLIMFTLGPFLLVFAYWENKFIISQYVMFWDNIIISYMGLLIYVLAGIIGIVSRLQLGKQGSGTLVIEDEHQLVEIGFYRYIRHPLYSAGLLGLLGVGLVFRSIIMTVFMLIVYFFIFKHRLEYEERILEEEFGEKYREYKTRTKRLIPFVY